MPLFLTLKSGEQVPLTDKVACVDYETVWSDDYSVSSMSYWHYTRDSRFHAYLVSIVTNTGLKWKGDPKDAPWEQIRDHVWVSHNTPFDSNCHAALQEKGVVPNWSPVYWGDSMTVCAYIRVPRALAKAVRILYGVTVSKKIRDVETKGKKWEEFSPDLRERIGAYAIADAEWSLKIWLDHVKDVPAHELRIADLIAARGLRGVAIDREGCERDMGVLKRILWAAEQKIPWAAESDVILSVPLLAAECRKNGIEPPPSLDMKDEACAEWENKYGDRFVWVGAMRDWRRANALLKKYQMIVERIKPDGRAEFSIKYMGAHTGRTAAGEKGYDKKRETFNMLNLPRSPFYVRQDLSIVHRKEDLQRVESHLRRQWMARVKAKQEELGISEARAIFLTPPLPSDLPEDITHALDLRAKIVPGKGNKFVICDMSQIEARITRWLTRDRKTLELIRNGLSVYEAHAIATMGYQPDPAKPLKKKNPQMYALAKARELGLGFGAGHVKFIVMAPTYVSDEDCAKIFGAPVSPQQRANYLQYLEDTSQHALAKEFQRLPEDKQTARVNSWLIVEDFRRGSPMIPAMWRKLRDDMVRSLGGNYLIELPSGRKLTYFDVAKDADGSLTARVERGGDKKFWHGGKLLENCAQSIARDVFVFGQLNLDDAGIATVLDVYDENICEVPLDFDPNEIVRLMTIPPPWATTLPLGAEAEESLFYKK